MPASYSALDSQETGKLTAISLVSFIIARVRFHGIEFVQYFMGLKQMNAVANPSLTVTPCLQAAAEMVTMRGMTALTKDHGPEADISDDPEALIALAEHSFAKAKRKAIAENDRLGITSYGGENGRLVARKPPAAKPLTPR